jgi:hypothetical protein
MPNALAGSTMRDGRTGQVRVLAGAAVAGLLVYVAVDAALRVLEPQYSLLRNAESDYANGTFGWLMDLNFVLRGASSLASVGAIALAYRMDGWLRVGLALIAAWAAASGVLAVFPDDLAGHPETAAGRIHLTLALIAFVSMAGGAMSASIALARVARGRAIGRCLGSLAIAALLALPLVARPPVRGDIGLFERIFLALELVWLLVAAGWTYVTVPGRG